MIKDAAGAATCMISARQAERQKSSGGCVCTPTASCKTCPISKSVGSVSKCVEMLTTTRQQGEETAAAKVSSLQRSQQPDEAEGKVSHSKSSKVKAHAAHSQ